MAGYILKRLGYTVIIVWAALTLIFVLFIAIPGSALDNLGGGNRAIDPIVKANIARKYGLDQPLHVQYGRYMKNLSTWNLGVGTAEPNRDRSVNGILKLKAANSARLAFWGIMVEAFFGIVIGLLAAVRRYSKLDYITGFIAVALTGIPVFVTGLLAQFFFAVLTFQHRTKKIWHWHLLPRWLRFPVQGIPDQWWFVFPRGTYQSGMHQWKSLVFPSIVIACVTTGAITRLARSSMLEVLRAEYMRTASAKGLSSRRVLFKHGLRNALIPVVTALGLDVVLMFGFAVLTETVFNWPGLGSTILTAAAAEDVPVVLGLSIPVIIAAALVTLLVDILYGVLDPRIRVEEGAAAG
jgi:oligopeptide transport system permease protein